ncbi:MAG: histidinol-phosphate transaminase [Ruminococcaceae bacterium]|nr:histidinol-phosphate transaminase [Oscillospiraceae bacterium]
MNSKDDSQSARRFWNSKTKALIPYVPGEQPRDRIRIKLNTNENPYAPAPEVMSALAEINSAELRLYPDPGSLELRQAISAYFGCKTDEVFVGNGSDEVLAMAFQAFFEPTGSGPAVQAITFPDVTYSFYLVYARYYNLNWRTIPLDENFQVPLSAFASPSGGIILANPNAPTGIALSLDAIAWLAGQDRNRLIIVDEAYVDFAEASAVALLGEYDNLLIIQTLSKSRALAGLRLGYALGAPALIEALERVRDSFNSYTVDRLAQTAGKAAFEASAWFEQSRRRIIASREKLADELRERHFTVLPSSANFLFVSPPGRSGLDFYRGLRQAGILVRHFKQSRVDAYVRISIGTEDDMDTLVRVIDEMLL